MIKYHPKRFEILVAMAQRGFNQALLSEKSGLNPSTLSTFLNGKRGISPKSAKKIADSLDSSPDELFEIEIKEGEEKTWCL